MHIVLPKLTVNGELVETAILASSIHGMEPRTVQVGGNVFNGTKVYGPFGSFKVPVEPKQIMAAQKTAITSGNMVQLDVVSMKASLAGPSVAQKQLKPAHKMLSQGKWK